MAGPDHDSLVAALLRVDGVADAAIEPDQEGPGVVSLRLVAGADEDAVASSVDRLLRANLDVTAELDRLGETPVRPVAPVPEARSEAEVLAEPAEPKRLHEAAAVRAQDRGPGRRRSSGCSTKAASPARLSIESVQTLTTRFRVVASVRLSMAGRTYEGEAEGARTGCARWVAAAALYAIEAAVGSRARFVADYVEFAGADRDQAVVCVVTMVSNGRIERLSGAVAVGDDIPQAVVQAVLAAVSRKVLSLRLAAP